MNFEQRNTPSPSDALQFLLELTPFPTTGLRRISINSFVYEGSNTHAVLDDAFNHMKSRGIDGKPTLRCCHLLRKAYPRATRLSPRI